MPDAGCHNVDGSAVKPCRACCVGRPADPTSLETFPNAAATLLLVQSHHAHKLPGWQHHHHSLCTAEAARTCCKHQALCSPAVVHPYNLYINLGKHATIRSTLWKLLLGTVRQCSTRRNKTTAVPFLEWPIKQHQQDSHLHVHTS